MDFTVPEHMRPVIETLRRFVDNEAVPLEAAAENGGEESVRVTADLRQRAIELGFFAMNMPADCGGAGFNAVEMCLVDEILGRTTATLVRRIFGHVHHALEACNDEQRKRYLERVVRGERIGCIAITEPEAGSDASNLSTSACRSGSGYVLNGRKHFISDGDLADFAIVVAATDREKGAKGGVTAFLVDKGTPGFTVGRLQPMMGHTGINHAELEFEDCYVDDSQVLGAPGQGFSLVMRSVLRVRLGLIGARGVGTAIRLLELSTEYARQRRQFGKPIGEFQMIQQMLADSATEIYAARMMVLGAASDLDAGFDARDKVSMVKLYSSEMVGRVADRAVQIFGGMGYCRELPIERLYRDVRVMRIYDGTSEVHRSRIATTLLRKGVDALNLI